MTLEKEIEFRHHHKKLKQRKTFTLKRDLNLFQATTAGVGIILGAGIYALIGVAAGSSGNALWLSFFFSAFVAAFTGLSYAELSSMFPKDAGEYLYTEHAFGKRLAFVVGYLVIIAGIIAASAVSLGFAGYFISLFGFGNILVVATAVILLFSFINFYGMKESSFINVIFTVIEVGGLILIIILAAKHFGTVDYLSMPQGFTGVLSGAALIFFAYIGFDSIIKLSEETKNASKIIPKALVLSIIISTILYVLVGLAAVSLLPWEQLAASSAPLADVAAQALGPIAFVILAVIALFSTGNTILMELVVTSRMLYGMGREGFWNLMGKVHKKRRTPHFAIIVAAIMAILFALIKDIGMVAEITNFAIFAIFITVNAAAICLRYKEPNFKRGFKMPLNIGKLPLIPVIGILATILLLVNLSRNVILGGIGMIIFGFLLYGGFELAKKHKSNKKMR